MKDDAWVEFLRDVGKVLWTELVDRYQFRTGKELRSWPAIVERRWS